MTLATASGVLRSAEHLGQLVVHVARLVGPGAEAQDVAEGVGRGGPAGVAHLGLDQVERDAEEADDAARGDQAAGIERARD